MDPWDPIQVQSDTLDPFLMLCTPLCHLQCHVSHSLDHLGWFGPFWTSGVQFGFKLNNLDTFPMVSTSMQKCLENCACSCCCLCCLFHSALALFLPLKETMTPTTATMKQPMQWQSMPSKDGADWAFVTHFSLHIHPSACAEGRVAPVPCSGEKANNNVF